VKEAVTEIKATARTDPSLGAEGAVLLLEKLSPPALAQVDSSSGAIGSAVNNGIETLVSLSLPVLPLLIRYVTNGLPVSGRQ
jgi:hypothetical protein